jgi:post-segregation antitoxin (ccd killing protein)
MRMARVNVYLPDSLAERARAAHLNVSGLTQEAVTAALERVEAERWIDRLEQRPRRDLSRAGVIGALDEARDELERRP